MKIHSLWPFVNLKSASLHAHLSSSSRKIPNWRRERRNASENFFIELPRLYGKLEKWPSDNDEAEKTFEKQIDNWLLLLCRGYLRWATFFQHIFLFFSIVSHSPPSQQQPYPRLNRKTIKSNWEWNGFGFSVALRCVAVQWTWCDVEGKTFPSSHLSSPPACHRRTHEDVDC